MSAITIALAVLACVIAGGALGISLNARLPDHHLAAESRDSVKQALAVLSTLTALVLGLLIATAKSSYDAKSEGLNEMAVDIVLLDRAMAQYGPETADARKLLRDSTRVKLEELWAEEGVRIAAMRKPGSDHPLEALQVKLRALTPHTDAQRQLQSRALGIAADLVKTRWLILTRTGTSIPTPFLIVLTLWLALMFIGLGLVAARNPTVAVAGIATAIAVAGAMFLILELDSPYHGVITISDGPLQLALENLGR